VTAIIVKFEKPYKKLLQNGKFSTKKINKAKAEVTEDLSTTEKKKNLRRKNENQNKVILIL